MTNNKYNNNMKESDFEFIKQNYNSMTVKELAQSLNKCTTTIYKALSKLKLEYENPQGKPWSEEEINYLKNNYLKFTYQEIADNLKRTKKSVEGKCKLLGLIKKTNSRNWTEEEITFLKENINILSYKEISQKINRNISAIYNKVYELQLIPDEFKKARKLKKEQVLFILANYENMTDAQLAQKFQCSTEAIADIRTKYGIKKTGNQISGPTYIEQIIMDLLEEYKIPYEYNKPLGNYIPDFQILNTKIIIEVQGDYFHCNPYLYKDGPEDEIQIKHVLKDYYKKCYFLSSGYTLIEFWETDINQNLDKIKEQIKTISAVCG